MYIGPWQEYRLAKIQDNAIQRLRQEWEEQLRGQLPATDDARIRELMQPMMAKQSELQSTSVGALRHVKCLVEDSLFNKKCRYALKPPKPTKKKKKKKKTQLTALEEVQKRKMMFATWIKHAGGSNDSEGGQQDSSRTPGGIGPELATLPREVAPASIVTRLPPISSAVPSSASSLLGSRPEMPSASPVHLPTLSQSSNNVTVLEQHDGSHVAGVLSSVSSPTAKDCEDADLDASLDEDEVNNLLNWTDTLLSPQAMDSFGELDD